MNINGKVVIYKPVPWIMYRVQYIITVYTKFYMSLLYIKLLVAVIVLTKASNYDYMVWDEKDLLSC